jgi:hypothetical protein
LDANTSFFLKALEMVGAVVATRWALVAGYRRAVQRQMLRREAPEPAALPPKIPAMTGLRSDALELLDVSEGLDGRREPVSSLMLIARRRRHIRSTARIGGVIAAALAQAAILAHSGVGFAPASSAGGMTAVLSMANALFATGLFLLVFTVPGLLRTGQASPVAWWLFALGPGIIIGMVPGVVLEDSLSWTTMVSAVVLIVGLPYLVFVGTLLLARFAQWLLRVSSEALAFLLAASAGSAVNGAVLALQTGTTLRWWSIALTAEVVLLLSVFAPGLWIRPGSTRTLLFLRTFGHASRSNHLLRAICRDWLLLGEVHLVVGPDLAASTADADGVTLFVTGRLGRHFISPHDVDDRVDAGASRPGRDGRYDVREFPCLADAWQATVRRLATSDDAILMDLRGLTGSNAGCALELATLAEVNALDRALFVVDETTDLDAMRSGLSAGGGKGHVALWRLGGRRDPEAVVNRLLTRSVSEHHDFLPS